MHLKFKLIRFTSVLSNSIIGSSLDSVQDYLDMNGK